MSKRKPARTIKARSASKIRSKAAGKASQRARSAVFGCDDCIAASSRAASLHCNARVSSILRNTGSSVCSAARAQSAAWSS